MTAYSDALAVIREKLDEWYAVRAELRAIDEAEHPAFRDKFGREWAWVSGDLWHHDDTLAYPRDMIDNLGLPPEKLRGNPNYWQLCDTCRSQWSDSSPVSPRCIVGKGRDKQWYDVRDGEYYDEKGQS